MTDRRQWLTSDWRRRLLVGLAGLTVIGAAGGIGFWQGHRYAVDRIETPAPVVDVEVAVERAAAQPEERPVVRMPDVTGLGRDVAIDVLADAGVDVEAVSFSSTPQVGPTDVVIGQDPRPRAEGPAAVTLTLSTSATVPDIVGAAEDEAVAALVDLGAEAIRIATYRQGATPGTVLDVTPETGTAIDGPVEVTVAVAADAVFVTALDAIDRDCRVEDVDLAGQLRTDALECRVPREGEDRQSYVLGGRTDRVDGVVGLAPRSDTAGRLQFLVLLDGEVAYDQSLSFGETAAFDVGSSGATRLDLVVRSLNTDDEDLDDAVLGVFADTRVLGSPEAIDALVTQ